MSPGGHIGRQSGAVRAKCACSGTIATDRSVWAPMPQILGRRGPCTQAKSQGRVTHSGAASKSCPVST